MTSRPLLSGRTAEGSRGPATLRGRRECALCAVVGVLVCLAVSVGTPYAPHVGPRTAPAGNVTLVVPSPAQGDQMYAFTSCTLPGGDSCLSPYNGLVTPLQVGTTVGLEFFTSIFASTPITGYVNWGDRSPVQSQQVSSGDCQCSFGPFTHTYNSAGTFTIIISDSYDGSESIGPFSVTEAAGVFSLSGAAVAVGGLLGLGAMAGALVSLRRPRMPVSASIPPPAVPTPVVQGSFGVSPTGQGGMTIPGTLEIPTGVGAPPGGWPAWAYDYRTTPYVPNPLYMGWTDLLAKFRMEHVGKPVALPNFPFMTNPAPPTDLPGVFYQARISPQTGQWAWWNPVTGFFL
jgi:hypothetical protein